MADRRLNSRDRALQVLLSNGYEPTSFVSSRAALPHRVARNALNDLKAAGLVDYQAPPKGGMPAWWRLNEAGKQYLRDNNIPHIEIEMEDRR